MSTMTPNTPAQSSQPQQGQSAPTAAPGAQTAPAPLQFTDWASI